MTLNPPTSDERIQMACTSELLKLYRERVHRPRSSCTQTKASDHLSLYSLADSEKTSQGLALNLSRKGHYYYHHFYFMLNIGHFMDIHRHWALDKIVNQGHFETFFRGIDIWPRPRLPASSHALILITWSLIGSLSQCCPIIDCHCEMFTCFQIVLSFSSVLHTLKYLLSLKIVSRNCLNLQ